MATTFQKHNGTGSQTAFAWTFPVYQATDIKVQVDGVLKTLTTHYTVATSGSSPNLTGTVTFTSGNIPPSGTNNVYLYRDTNVEAIKHSYTAGSAVKADHLNNNTTQLLYALQEEQNQTVRSVDIDDDVITSAKIKNDSIVNADINTGAAIGLSKLATGALPSAITVASANIVDGTIVAGDLASNSVTTAKILDNNVTDAKISAVASSKITGTITPSDATVTSAKFHGDLLVTAAEQASHSANDTSVLTTAAGNARYYGKGTVEEIQSGETWSAADDKVATTAAIDARVIDLVDDVGGFWPIANETSFPTANPDVNNGAGTIVSIKSLVSALTSNGSGVATINNGAGSGKNITIEGLANSTTYGAGTGMLVETTTTSGDFSASPPGKYIFHRTTPNATEVTTVATNIANVNTVATNVSNVNSVAGNATNINTVAGNNTNINTVAGANANIGTVATNISDVNNFADLYQIANSAPGTDGGGNALAAGDLWFDSSSNKTLKVHNGTAFASVSPSQSVLDDISIVSGSLTRTEDLGSVADAIASDSSTGALDTCATNITNINSFANVYRIASSAPSSSLDEGDLWYDSTANKLKYYNGTTWTVTAAAGLSEVVEDTSPELGGNLDCNNKNLTEVGTVSGDNLQIDFGAIA